MACAVIVVSSESDTDVNSDTETCNITISQKYSVNTQKFGHIAHAHEISDSNSDSDDSLPEINFLTKPSPLKSPLYKEPDDCVNFRANILLGSDDKSHHRAPSTLNNIKENLPEIANKLVKPKRTKRSIQCSQESSSSSAQTQCSQESSSSSVKSSEKLTIVFEKSLSEEKFFKELVFLLEAADVAHTTENLPLAGSMFWTNSRDTALTENQIVLHIDSSKLIRMVNNFKKSVAGEETLLALVQHTVSVYDNCKITIITLGMRKYFQSKKSKEAREFRETVFSQPQSQQPKKRTNRDQTPQINKVDLDEAIIDLQLQANVNFRLLENASELSELLVSFTKSITEAPRKRAKHDHGFSWHMQSDSTDTVKIDKNMTNMYKLWVQQLMQFHQVSKDIAQAIAAKFPSPQSLIRAYRKCYSEDEAANLLKNIEVRRGSGPLAATRRVGPELSFKIHALLTTHDPKEILHTM